MREPVGPIWRLRGEHDGYVRLAATVVLSHGDAPPPLELDGVQAQATAIGHGPAGCVWSFDLAPALYGAQRVVPWHLGERHGTLALPGLAGPLRLSYVSCNGSPDDAVMPAPAGRRNLLWARMLDLHARAPLHLLVHGGDQLYADAVWRVVPALAAWRRLPRRRRLAAPAPPALRAAAFAYYFDRYCAQWSQPEVAAMLARVPSLMMWDDHDIFDGWGSQDPAERECPVQQAVWSAAREAFALFQLGTPPDAPPAGLAREADGYGWTGRLGATGFVVLDLRSHRTRARVLEAGAPGRLAAALAALAGCRRILVVASVPLAGPGLHGLDALVCRVPGRRLHQDDLRDQWLTVAHRDEWARLCRVLLDHRAATGVPITLLSGEIHLGALGRIADGRAALLQFVASGVAHDAPPAPFRWLLEALARRPVRHAGLTADMLPLPGLPGRFLRARNFLHLEVETDGALTAAWHHDGASVSPLVWRAGND